MLTWISIWFFLFLRFICGENGHTRTNEHWNVNTPHFICVLFFPLDFFPSFSFILFIFDSHPFHSLFIVLLYSVCQIIIVTFASLPFVSIYLSIRFILILVLLLLLWLTSIFIFYCFVCAHIQMVKYVKIALHARHHQWKFDDNPSSISKNREREKKKEFEILIASSIVNTIASSNVFNKFDSSEYIWGAIKCEIIYSSQYSILFLIHLEAWIYDRYECVGWHVRANVKVSSVAAAVTAQTTPSEKRVKEIRQQTMCMTNWRLKRILSCLVWRWIHIYMKAARDSFNRGLSSTNNRFYPWLTNDFGIYFC